MICEMNLQEANDRTKMKQVFHLPEEAKLKIANPVSLNPQRGWSGVGVETTASLTGNTKAEFSDAKVSLPTLSYSQASSFTNQILQEHYDFGTPTDENFPNRWREEPHLPGFRTFVESYFNTLHEVALSLIKMIEMGFGLPTDTMSQM